MSPTERSPESTLWLTLVAMTLANSMILVDQTAVPLATPEAIDALGGGIDEGQWLLTANILPLAAFMVLGGRLGDMMGLRRTFLAGAGIFMISTVMAGAAQDMPWILSARVAQGLGAACMMPTAVAIVSAVAPVERRGWALGVLAGGSAFFAALGPVLGGALTAIDWRLVFLINVPLAIAVTVMTLRGTPALDPTERTRFRDLDFAGMALLAIGSAGVVLGLAQISDDGVSSPTVLVPLIASVAAFAGLVAVELTVADPLIDLRLFRHKNFLAANISQVIAGAVELGMGFLLPFLMLLVIGVGPFMAGIALIPATIPIILAGPLAGRWFDKVGGRTPLVVGFTILAASGVALAVGASDESALSLIPGLALQGIGLGIVLTVNDPVGLNAVPEGDRGRAAGMINTSEQLGGALGISILLAIELSTYRDRLFDRLADRGIHPSQEQIANVKDFIVRADQQGIHHVQESGTVRAVIHDLLEAHVHGFQIAFLVGSALALVGGLACFALVRTQDRLTTGGVFSRRSRWIWANSGRTPALTRHPPAG